MYSRINIELRPAWLVGLLAALPWFALGGFSAALALTGNVWLTPVLALTLIGGTAAIRCQGLLTDQDCVIGLSVHDNQLLARQRDGSVVAVSPGACSRIGARFSVLRLRKSQNNRYYATVLLLEGDCGNVPADHARRLRLWLRLGHKPVPDLSTL